MKKYVIKITLAISILICAVHVNAQKWNLDKSHAKVGFTVNHLVISEVDGYFKNFDATMLVKSPSDFTTTIFTLTAQTSSIDTDNERRDKHLRSEDFFDAEKFPTVNFVSTAVKKINNNNYTISGFLTMHGISRSIELKASITAAKNPMAGNDFAVVIATGKIKRSDFGIGNDTPTAMVGDEITLNVKGEFTTD